MVSTPIKNVYAGDFSLGGYPLTYQRYLKVKLSRNLSEASFEIPISKQGSLIADYNYALALKVEGYNKDKTGAIDHKNLNGLDGIIRLPYYEDKERAKHYPRHKYITTYYWYDNDYNLNGSGKKTDSIAASTSFFGYFDTKDLKPVSKVDSVPRFLALDYCFLFEDDKTGRIGTTFVVTDRQGGKKEVEGYSLKCNWMPERGNYTLVGNPFMCPIDYSKLLKANGKKS